MLRLLLALVVTLLAGCATTSSISTEYAGPDGGQVVVGIGAAKGTNYGSYSLYFRSLDAQAQAGGPKPSGRFVYFQDNPFSLQKRDYDTSAENGVVFVASLPPGRYEIFNFNVFLNAGMTQTSFGSRTDFSIPFEVKPGKAVYLGNFQANGVRGQNIFGMSIAAGAFFVVDSRLQADIALARARGGPRPVPADVADATPSVAAIASPFFVERK